MARDYGNLKNLGHYQEGNITALYLRGERQDLEEMRIIQNLDNATCVLIIGINDPRRNSGLPDVPYYTAVSRDVVPIAIRQSGKTWLSIYDRITGEPLNGGALHALKVIQRASFDTPHDEYGAA
jgi:hypothetical protein